MRAGASGNTHQSELSGERPAGPPPPPGRPSSPEPWQRVRAPLSSPSDSKVPSETSLLGLSTRSRCGDPRYLLRGEGPGGSRPTREHSPGRLAQRALAGPLAASLRLTPGPQGCHQPAETCPSTAGTPRLLTAARPVPAHRASGTGPRSAHLEAWTRRCLCLRLLGSLRARHSHRAGAGLGRGFLPPPLALGESPRERGGCSQEPGWSPQKG